MHQVSMLQSLSETSFTRLFLRNLLSGLSSTVKDWESESKRHRTAEVLGHGDFTYLLSKNRYFSNPDVLVPQRQSRVGLS